MARALPRGSFRPALAWTGAVGLAALAAMAVIVAISLKEADGLLDRLSRAQDQLAQVTRIEADINRLRADAATGARSAETLQGVADQLGAYRASVLAEAKLGRSDADAQAREADTADHLSAAFEAFRADPDAGDAARLRFEDLARRVVASERLEARAAIGDMADLRRAITILGVAIPLVVAVVGAAGAWIMLASNRELETQVAARTAEIGEVDRTRRLFFSKLGHELRTPATVILGEAEVALRDANAPAARLREALGHVAVNGQVLRRRLEDMLALAAAEDGRIVLRREPVDLAAVVRAAAALAEPYVRSSGLDLAAEAPAGAGPILQGDASWLQQALLALVDNAAKFASPGQPIRLALSNGDGAARLTVSDNGPGVDPADLPFVFEAYYQASAGRARGGSGLGLSIARWVAEQHGGAISAISPPGQGLTVEITLPVQS